MLYTDMTKKALKLCFEAHKEQVDKSGMAIAWSGSLNFTVERSGKSLIGSAASGEGLVNVYRGTGKVLLAPVTQGAV